MTRTIPGIERFRLPHAGRGPTLPVMTPHRIVALALVVLAGPLAHAQAIDPGAIARLDHPDLAERERATALLAEGSTLERLRALEDEMRRNDLTPEQRVRLRASAQRVFDSRPRAGLGVSFAPGPEEGPVAIGQVIAGFPAALLLRGGDILTMVAGHTLRGTAHMQWIILSHEPGDTMPVVLRRPGINGDFSTVELEVPLGNFADLDNTRELPPASLRAAYDIRLTREGVRWDPAGHTAIAGAALDPLDWLRAEGLWVEPGATERFNDIDLTRPAGRDTSRFIAFGGQPGAATGDEPFRAADPNWRERAVNRRLASREPMTELEQLMAYYRLSALRIVELDRRLLPGREPEGRIRSLDGFERERDQGLPRLAEAAMALKEYATRPDDEK